MLLKDKDNIIERLHNHNIIIETRELFLNPKDSNSETDIELTINFLKNLRLLESISKDNIVIHQYNDGGQWNASFGIYDAIREAESYITMVCHAEVMSAGILILQAADCRISMPNCEFLIHEGTTGIHENLSHKQAKSWSLREKQKEELLYEIYTEKCMNGQFFLERNYKKNRIKAYLKAQISKNEDLFLSPQEAMEYGFIDDIIGSKKYPHISSILVT